MIESPPQLLKMAVLTAWGGMPDDEPDDEEKRLLLRIRILELRADHLRLLAVTRRAALQSRELRSRRRRLLDDLKTTVSSFSQRVRNSHVLPPCSDNENAHE